MDKEILINNINPEDESTTHILVELDPKAERIVAHGFAIESNTQRIISLVVIKKDQQDVRLKIFETQPSESQEKTSVGRGRVIKPNAELFDRCYLNQYQGLTMLLFVYRIPPVPPENAPETLLAVETAQKLLEQLHGILDESKSE